jgi:hypothetical protein
VCDFMYVSSEDTAVIYARACRAWYGKRAPLVVRRRIEELRQAGDVDGVTAWTQVASELSQLHKSPSSASEPGRLARRTLA